QAPPMTPPPSLSLRLVLAGAWAAVRSRSRGQFPRVLGLLEAVGRAAPGAVRFRHGARLRLGLQAAVSTLTCSGWRAPCPPPTCARWAGPQREGRGLGRGVVWCWPRP
uniref:TERF1-interacting nuclear factor 2 N-terminal domain-containing protein n=1 Tax=Strix occidentalis caurina TaxID=311401 RepID=A0A8D0FDW5_STROC